MAYRIGIVGRTNVGKSSLFNALLGYRRTIVLDLPGTTLDEITEKVKWGDAELALTDTFGVMADPDVRSLEKMLASYDAVFFVVDAKSGVVPLDLEVGKTLARWKKPVLIIINKSDARGAQGIEGFAELGFSSVIEVSAAHRRGFEGIRAWAQTTAGFPPKIIPEKEEWEEEASPPEEKPKPSEPGPIKIALVGKPNTGKSTLMNRLAGARVSRVSPEPLTTRDMVSAETAQGGVRLFDTAGMRRPRSVEGNIEVYSTQASRRAVRDADVVFLCVAAHEPISDQDVRLLNLLERESKPTIILFNFSDRLSPKEQSKVITESDFSSLLKRFPHAFISGLAGSGVEKLVPMAERLVRAADKRIKTSKLNAILERIVDKNPPPSLGTKNFNILYASQVKTRPPTIVFFMNRKEALPESYQKYLSSELKAALRLKGQPLKLFFRAAPGRG